MEDTVKLDPVSGPPARPAAAQPPPGRSGPWDEWSSGFVVEWQLVPAGRQEPEAQTDRL
ncbi:MAG TPA: hypothetical protein VKL22_05940 [Actinomycetota bacterium]|nr:hypothetical protein [Actinomycetota bacterium]